MRSSLYYHSPCFDGICAAVLAWHFLREALGWDKIRLRPVGYHLRNTWLTMRLDRVSAVVDFLYHPGATFWCDHHITSFATEDAKLDFQETSGGRYIIYDEKAGSCTHLLWNELHKRFGFRRTSCKELVSWADKIDTASYDSPQEAVFGSAPPLRIMRSLGSNRDGEYTQRLVRLLYADCSFRQAVQDPYVRKRLDQEARLTQAGLSLLKENARLRDGIVLFDVDISSVLINRYMPYVLFPDAVMSVGITRESDQVKLTAMRNPWGSSVGGPSIGEVMAKMGGGGHERVGSVILKGKALREAEQILHETVAELSNAS